MSLTTLNVAKADLVQREGSDSVAHIVTCPRCGHMFRITRLYSAQERCPVCYYLFNVCKDEEIDEKILRRNTEVEYD